VQGSRYLPGGIAENTPRDREFGVRFLHAPLISLGAGVRYTDTTNGFRAFSRRLLLDPRCVHLGRFFDTYNLHYYLAVRAPRLAFRVCEIPVARRYPKTGPAPSKIAGWSAKFHILKQTVVAGVRWVQPVMSVPATYQFRSLAVVFLGVLLPCICTIADLSELR